MSHLITGEFSTRVEAEEAVADLLRVGVPREEIYIEREVVPEELEGRRGKQADGKAKTRQVYLGCVFTQHEVDEEGHPVRDWESTTYVSSFKSSDEFGPCLRQEALRRGMGSVEEVVVLIDGANGLENLGKLNFKDCVQIVDFYHALEHAGHVLSALIGKGHPDYKTRQHRQAAEIATLHAGTLGRVVLVNRGDTAVLDHDARMFDGPVRQNNGRVTKEQSVCRAIHVS